MMKRFLLWTAGVLLVVAAALAIVLSQIDTAFDIAGKGVADAGSLIEAVRMAKALSARP